MCFGNLPKNQYFAIFRPKRVFFGGAHFLNKCRHLTVGDLNYVHINDVHVNEVHVNDVHLICYGRFF